MTRALWNLLLRTFNYSYCLHRSIDSCFAADFAVGNHFHTVSLKKKIKFTQDNFWVGKIQIPPLTLCGPSDEDPVDVLNIL